MKIVQAIALGAATMIGVSAGSQAATPDRYLVMMKISDQGVSLGEPRLVVVGGEAGKIELSGPDGTKFSMAFTVVPHGNAMADVASQIEVVERGGRSVKASPTLLVQFGEAAGVEFGDSSPTRTPMIVEFTVSKTDKLVAG